MTTTQEAPARQPTLRERVAVAAAEAQAAQRAREDRQMAARCEQVVGGAIDIATRTLGVTLDPTDITFTTSADGYGSAARFTCDGFSFVVRLDNYIRPLLYVEHPCSRAECVHADQLVEQPIFSLVDLDAPREDFAHTFACHYPLDEYGDPILPPEELAARRARIGPPEERAIAAIETAAEALGAAITAEAGLEDERPIIKAAAVKRIMARDGIAATPAEKIVETDEEFLAHRAKQSAAVVAKQRAYGAYEAAKLRAQLAVNLAGRDR